MELCKSNYPDFSGGNHYLFVPKSGWLLDFIESNPVEVDVYQSSEHNSQINGYLGIDVGSTSTKAALCSKNGSMIAGFYTRTAGKPIEAVQSLFAAIEDWTRRCGLVLEIPAIATTGSGRKLIAAVFGADLVIDEISAHARAACELDPHVDTIIEIGGQDAKFTALKDGRVTFSKMNAVCAAGTGSFLEEQAARVGVSVDEYAEVSMGSRSPLTSDRCTVFMERDINCYQSRGYAISEILAAAAHSVCENYLVKVASQAHIGSAIAFQGATAKNRALVSAFEEKLGKGLSISPYCHLTGAYGAALEVAEYGVRESLFGGLSLWRESIPIAAEQCTYCKNRCRITVADINGTKAAYGFLCGRDYESDGFVEMNSSGFDLLQCYKMARRNAFTVEPAGEAEIGIPMSLHLADEAHFWAEFFHRIGYTVIVGNNTTDTARQGKLVSGAEFCAPIAAFHGNCQELANRCKMLFIPVYLDDIHPGGGGGKYCYYTQFAPPLVKSIEERSGTRCIMPVLNRGKHASRTKRVLHKSLSEVLQDCPDLTQVSRGYEAALEARVRYREALLGVFDRREQDVATFDVVLLGRPYTVLDPEMNKRIPLIFGSLGIRAYYQDMLDRRGELDPEVEAVIDIFHWHYAIKILTSTALCAKDPSLYPVLITSFKCSPDSFLIEYFTRIMNHYHKPYLILQIDEHGSNVGYETRIEAAVRAFQNHYSTVGKTKKSAVAPAGEGAVAPAGEGAVARAVAHAVAHAVARAVAHAVARAGLAPVVTTSLQGKTVLFPNWDTIASPLVVANLRWAGYDVRLLEEDADKIRESMRENSGQCIPVHIILHEFIEYIRNHNLEPSKTVLWMAESEWACNIQLFPHYIKSMLDSHNDTMCGADVYLGAMFHQEISSIVGMRAYFAYLFGGLIRKLACNIRPYEINGGETDRVVLRGQEAFISAFLGDRSLDGALTEVVGLFEDVAVHRVPKPKVAIFGDFYVRDNDIMNQDLVRYIEASGGEVITTPLNEYLRIISSAYFKRWLKNGRYNDVMKFGSLRAVVDLIEKKYRRHFPDIMRNNTKRGTPDVEALLARFNISLSHEGESHENLLKIMHILDEHPEISLFVQTNPAFCCPSLVTEAMSADIERVTGVPVVSITYDGTESWKNGVIAPYLHFACERTV